MVSGKAVTSEMTAGLTAYYGDKLWLFGEKMPIEMLPDNDLEVASWSNRVYRQMGISGWNQRMKTKSYNETSWNRTYP